MRASLICILLLIPLLLLSQQEKSELISLDITDQSLEVILDSVSSQTAYFFSYNPEVFPAGSKYSISCENEPIDQFLSRLLVGTALKYTFFKDQIIINYQPPEKIVIRKKNFFTVGGKVVDENNNPIVGVNVFLDGTSIGSFSDASGNYLLEAIPPGFYDLVFSHIGYENGTYQISENNGGARIQNHSLVTAVEELEDITIVSDKIMRLDDSWIEHYHTFREELLGRSKNSKMCVIENPEVIRFAYDERNNQLRVFAKDAIVIRNDMLGYRIDYFLESFIKESQDLRFRGKIRYRNQIPISALERRRWKRNRRESYNGSFGHFKQALLNQELAKEGFKIYSTGNLVKANKREMEELTEKDIIVFKGNLYQLSFRKNLLVEYTREKESFDFLNNSDFVKNYYKNNITEDGILVKSPSNQISIIRLLKPSVRIDDSGQILDKFALSTYGYWSWERLTYLVPKNYDPKWDNL